MKQPKEAWLNLRIDAESRRALDFVVGERNENISVFVRCAIATAVRNEMNRIAAHLGRPGAADKLTVAISQEAA
jgi:hypothetical protein